MPVELTSQKDQMPRREWQVTGRFVLVCLLSFFAVVVSVNVYMMTMAIKTFSGVEARNGYDLSQTYNTEIARAREQSQRHWQSDIVVVRDQALVNVGLTLRDAQGQPVTGLAMDAQVKHPTDRRLDHKAVLKEEAPGVYTARLEHVGAGVWAVNFTGSRDGSRIYNADTRVSLTN